MAIPTDIAAWLEKHRPCIEGADRLADHASMAAAWEASTHGPYLAWILKREGKLTDAAKSVKAEHTPRVREAQAAAKTPVTGRLQDADPAYAKALSDYATALKSVVDNPFT